MAVDDDRVQRISNELDAWQRQRALSKAVRRDFTDVLKGHGADRKDYAICTHIGYLQSLGKSARDLRLERGLRIKDNLRNHLTVFELAKVSFVEALAGDRIAEECCRGGRECRAAMTASARWVSRCLADEMADRSNRQPRPANDPAGQTRAA